MSRLVVVALILAGCGRVDFDPRTQTTDASDSGDAPSSVAISWTPTPTVVSWNATVGLDQMVARPVDAVDGDLVLLHITWAHNYGDLVIPSGWSVGVPEWREMHCNTSSSVLLYRVVTAGDTAYPVTCNGFCSGAAFAVHGVDVSRPFAATGTLATTTQTQTCGTAVSPQLQVAPALTANAGDVALVFYGDNNDDAAGAMQSLPSSLTTVYSALASADGGQNVLAGASAPLAAGSTGDQTVTVVNEILWGWTAVQVALQPAP